jgi:hypothetical protein
LALPLPAVVDADSPVAVADPALAALLAAELLPASGWTWTRPGGSVTLADLGLDVPDVVLLPDETLLALAAADLGGDPDGGTARGQRAELDRLASLLDAQRACRTCPASRRKAARMRGSCGIGSPSCGTSPPGCRPTWRPSRHASARRCAGGCPVTGSGAQVLGARLAAAGDPTGDATADAAALAERIRALLAPVSGLPLVCAGVLPPVLAAPDLDRDWLEIVAAVRPAVARLEAAQLRRGWPAAATDPAALWTTPEQGARQVVVYGPAAGTAAPCGIALLDDWAETVPSARHTTHAAFGFDAPRARAQQAVLLAVPPDEQVPLAPDALPAIVLAAREQARARMAQPDQLVAWTGGAPSSMVLVTGPAGATLVEP